MTEEKEEHAFLQARTFTGRDAFTLFKKANNIDGHDAGALAIAAVRFRTLPLLLDPVLGTRCFKALSAAVGSSRTGAEPFPATIWTGGAEHTHGGRPFLGTLQDFAERILPARAKEIAPKRSGWVVEPTTNPVGRRTNEETRAVHALFLDCDSTGEWHRLLMHLEGRHFCYIAYQSGGWAPATPKWRVILPLETPHDTTTEKGREAWRSIYAHARVVFGAIGGLLSVGFDASTDTPCCPWFLTEKRAPGDPERLIRWRPGYALDLTAMALALPAVETVETQHEDRGQIVTLTLDATRFEQIVDTLAGATVHVPAGRRDIYLAMPAVLLNRGVPPDDVLAIVEEVSLRYPRQHVDKHADNIHCARTTIDRWLAEGSAARITQIGTLQALAPEVAAALDEAVPDPLTKAFTDMFDMEESALPAAPSPPTTTPIVRVAPPPPRRRRKLSRLGRVLSPVAARLRKHKNADRQVQGYLLERIVRGESLRPPGVSLDRIEDLVSRAMETMGFHLHEDTSWQAALDEAGPTLLSMDFTQSTEHVAAARAAFDKGQLARRRAKHKRAVKKENDRATRERDARKCVL